MNAMGEMGLVKILVAMKMLSLWQQRRPCLIMLIVLHEGQILSQDFFQPKELIFQTRKVYLLQHQTSLRFYHFVSKTSFSNVKLNNGH